MLFIISILSSGSLLPYALVGGLVTLFVGDGIFIVGDLGVYKVEHMYKDLVVATKTSAMEYMIGVVIASLLWSSPTIVLYLILDVVYHLLTPYAFFMTVLISVFVLISTACIAFVVSSVVRHIRNIWSIASILTTLLTVVPPTFYPYVYLPHSALLVLLILPTTSAAVLEQGVFGLAPMVWSMFYVLIAETAILLLIARYFTVWREK